MFTTAGLRRAAMSAKLIDVGVAANTGASEIAAGAAAGRESASERGADAVRGSDSRTPSSTPMMAVRVAVVITYSRVMIPSL